MRIHFGPLLLSSCLGLSLSGCSLDVIPVHFSKVNSVKQAEKPLARGPQAPGAFKTTLEFKQAQGYVFDPSLVEIHPGGARLKPEAKNSPRKDRATLETTRGLPYAALDSFAEILSDSKYTGAVKYQLSSDGARWFHHNGKAWTQTAPIIAQTNTASEVNAHIGTFHSEAGTGDLQIRAFFGAGGPTSGTVSLQQLEVQGIAPKTDGWD